MISASTAVNRAQKKQLIMRISFKLIFTILSLMPIFSLAQTTSIPIYTIRHNVEMSVVSELAGHPEWGVRNLLKNVSSTLPSSVKPATAAPATSVMTPQQLYKERHESALIFGKAGLCPDCPELHTVFIATAIPVTKDGICLVNYHMVQSIIASAHSAKSEVMADSIFFVADRDGQCYPLTHILAYSRDDDAAVIKVDTRGNSLDIIPLGQSAETGQHISIVSHPKQMFYTFSEGYVTRNAVYNFPDNPIIDMMEISADFAEGSSGGPVMDDCGNLVGMVRATTTIFHDEQNRNTQMVRKTTVPIKVLKKLLRIEK